MSDEFVNEKLKQYRYQRLTKFWLINYIDIIDDIKRVLQNLTLVVTRRKCIPPTYDELCQFQYIDKSEEISRLVNNQGFVFITIEDPQFDNNLDKYANIKVRLRLRKCDNKISKIEFMYFRKEQVYIAIWLDFHGSGIEPYHIHKDDFPYIMD